MLDFFLLSQLCAPNVHADTMHRLVRVESSFNPYAVGVVGSHLQRQPRSRNEAIAVARWLGSQGYNYSVGLAQINVKNFAAQGLDVATAFDPCRNLQAGSRILADCYRRALQRTPDVQRALRAALSCYESGNFITGLKDGYVLKLLNPNNAMPPPSRRDIGVMTDPAAVKNDAILTPSAPSAIPATSIDISLPRASLR